MSAICSSVSCVCMCDVPLPEYRLELIDSWTSGRGPLRLVLQHTTQI